MLSFFLERYFSLISLSVTPSFESVGTDILYPNIRKYFRKLDINKLRDFPYERFMKTVKITLFHFVVWLAFVGTPFEQ